MNLPSKAEPQSSQILSLVEALNTAKREIDSQGDKVKHLEVLLNRERKARESAEEKARRLLEGHTPAKVNGHVMSTVDEDAFEPPSELSEDRDVGLTNGYHDPNDSEERLTDASSIVSSSTVKSPEELHSETKQVEASTSRLQERLDLMVREMDDMKVVMENYKRRAEDAEEERNTLRDMIEKIRATGASSNGKLVSKAKTSPEDDPSDEIINESESQALTSTERRISMSQPYARANGSASGPTTIIPDLKELERTVSSVLQQTQPRGQGAMVNGNLAMQSAPYVSMVGVVLLGVGIMTWLNGWQREKI
jgi:predicted  nucleic acid-binding Zn-ribbon protein